MPIRPSNRNGIRDFGHAAGKLAFDHADSVNGVMHIDGIHADALFASYQKSETTRLPNRGRQVYYYEGKIGETNQRDLRTDEYIRKKFDLETDDPIPDDHGVELIPIHHLDRYFGEETDAVAKAIVQDTQLGVAMDESYPFALRRFNSMLVEDEAGSLGFNRCTFTRLVEIGAQDHFESTGRMMEIFMGSQSVLNNREAHVLAAANAMCEAMEPYLLNDVQYDSDFVGSWNTGAKNFLLSSKIVATDALGCVDFEDTLPEPAVENAETAAEIFSTDFTPKALNDGWAVLERRVKGAANQTRSDKRFAEYHQPRRHILFLDTNQLLCDYHGINLDACLREMGFELKASVLDDSIKLFVHKESHGMIITHKPLGVAGDGLPNPNAVEMVIARGLEAAVLQQVSFRVQGIPALPKHRPVLDFVVAGFCYEITANGYHLSRRTAAVMFRNALTTDNAIKKSRLQGSQLTGDEALSYNVRNMERGYGAAKKKQKKMGQVIGDEQDEAYYHSDDDDGSEEEEDNTTITNAEQGGRVSDGMITQQARNIISQVKDPSAHDKLGDCLDELFKKDFSDSKKISARWIGLLRSFNVPGNQACKHIRSILRQQRKRLRSTNGNKYGKGLTLDERKLYEKDWQRALKRILSASNPKHEFYCFDIKVKDDSEEEKTRRYHIFAETVDGLPVVKGLVFHGIKQRIRTMNQRIVRHRNTNAKKTKSFPPGITYGLRKAVPSERNHPVHANLVKASLQYTGEEEEEDLSFMDDFFSDDEEDHEEVDESDDGSLDGSSDEEDDEDQPAASFNTKKRGGDSQGEDEGRRTKSRVSQQGMAGFCV